MPNLDTKTLNTQQLDVQNVQPAKLRDARRFADMLAKQSNPTQLFHAWRP